MLTFVRFMHTETLIAAYLRMLVEQGRLQRPKFAAALGVKPQTFNKMWNHGGDFPMKHLDGAAAFFNKNAAEFIEMAREEVAAAETADEEARRLLLLQLRLPVRLGDEADDDGDS